MSSSARKVAFVTEVTEAGQRLDQVLAARVPGLSRRQARVVLDLGGVFVDRRRVKVAGRAVHAGQRIEVHLGGALGRAAKQVGSAARSRDEASLPRPCIVHEDEDLLVVDKPAGLLTAPTPESDRGNLLSLLSRDPARGPVSLVHRIDLSTSGLLVFAKSALALRSLAERFRCHDVTRSYLTVLVGPVVAETQRVDQPIGGRPAISHFEVRERLGTAATLLEVRLETGRTHQIRLHARGLGHPVAGDPRYGRGAPALDPAPPRMALHATALGFAHPRSGAPCQFSSPWPADLGPWLEALRQRAR